VANISPRTPSTRKPESSRAQFLPHIWNENLDFFLSWVGEHTDLDDFNSMIEDQASDLELLQEFPHIFAKYRHYKDMIWAIFNEEHSKV